MKRLHLIFGVLIVLAFLLTGEYMQVYRHHLVGYPDGIRLLYRTRHIYILLAGLLNLGLAAYLVARRSGWQLRLQQLGSGLIICASLLFVAAFFYDPQRGDLSAPLTRWAVYAIAVGTLSHVFSMGRHNTPDAARTTR